MESLFKILATLNYVACVLALTINLLYYRRPKKKDSSEEMRKEQRSFRQHWIVMAWWVIGTVLIPAFDLNILWIVPWMILGSYSSSLLSGSSKPQDRRLAYSAPLTPQTALPCEPTALKPSKKSSESEKARDGAQQASGPIQSSRLPDLGKHLALKGTPQKKLIIYPSFTITEIAVVGLGRYCTNMVQEMNGSLFFGTFDFGDDVLGRILTRASDRTKDIVIGTLTQDPESVRRIPVTHPINVGIGAVLGNPQQGIDEAFIPFVITEVF
jgi:hypothetical protein